MYSNHLTTKQRRTMLNKYRSGKYSFAQLAREFGIKKTEVRKIVHEQQ